MKPILFCYWDLSQHEKCMPPSPNLDGLTYMTPFSKLPQQSEITFFACYSTSRVDRDKIFGSRPMLLLGVRAMRVVCLV